MEKQEEDIWSIVQEREKKMLQHYTTIDKKIWAALVEGECTARDAMHILSRLFNSFKEQYQPAGTEGCERLVKDFEFPKRMSIDEFMGVVGIGRVKEKALIQEERKELLQKE